MTSTPGTTPDPAGSPGDDVPARRRPARPARLPGRTSRGRGPTAALGAVALAVALVGATACGAAVAPGPASATAPSGAVGGAAAPGVAAPPTIPMTVAHEDHSGAACPVVDVAVGGGAPVRVEVDTGSSGLVLDRSAIGPQAAPTGRSYGESFLNSTPFRVDVVRAPVGVGGPDGPMVVTTPAPIAVGSLSNPAVSAGQSTRCGPVHGVLGLGTGNPDATAPPLISPLIQLAPPLSGGFGLTVTGSTGTITVGRPTPTDRSVVVPLTRANGAYPDGRPLYERDVTLCWTVGRDRGCGPTNVDTGAPIMLIRPDLLPGGHLPPVAPGRSGQTLPTGTPVAISGPSGGPLLTTTTASSPPERRAALTGLFGDTRANTGIGFFESATVAYDLDAGQAVITPR